MKFSVLNIDFLSRRDRNQGSQGRPAAVRTGGAASEDEALCGLVGPGGGRNNNCYLLVISTSALILLLVLAYFTSSLHSRIVTLEQQLRWEVDEYSSDVQTKMFVFRMKIADDDSNESKLLLLDSKVQSMLSNQSQVVETLSKLTVTLEDSQTKLRSLNGSLEQQRRRGQSESLKVSEVRRELELLTNISRNNEDSVRQITDILTSLNITHQATLVNTPGRP